MSFEDEFTQLLKRAPAAKRSLPMYIPKALPKIKPISITLPEPPKQERENAPTRLYNTSRSEKRISQVITDLSEYARQIEALRIDLEDTKKRTLAKSQVAPPAPAKPDHTLARQIKRLEKQLEKLQVAAYQYGSSLLQITANNTFIGNANGLDFEPGTGITITTSTNPQGALKVTITAAPNIMIPTGAVDGSNKAFVFPSKPNLVNVDGAFYRENHGWTWTAATLTATLDNPAGLGGDVYGI